MSYYENDRPRRHHSTRERRNHDDYDADPYYKSGGGGRETSLVRKPRNDSFSSFEEVQRDFAPADAITRKTTTVRQRTRARSAGGRERERERYHDPYDDRSSHHDDYATSKRGSKRYDDKRRTRRRGSSSDSSMSRSPPRRRKSMGEQALAALGLSGIAAAATGKSRDRSHSRSRHHRDRSSSSSRSRSRRGGKEEIAQALKAAITAGVAEAVRSRHQSGGWAGDKGKRVITAAISAGGIDKLIDRDPHKHGKRNVLGSAVAGLAANHFVNGSRSRSRSRGRGRHDHGRARSESRGGLKGLASAGILTAAGKQIFDKVRSKSRGRRSSDSSYDSYDSRGPPRRHDKKKRSSSIAAYATKGLTALGLGEAADKLGGREKHRSATFDDDGYRHRSSHNGAPPPYGGGGYSDSREVGQPRNGAMVPRYDTNSLDLGPHSLDDIDTDSDSDLGDSSEDERERKKARRTQMITASLATVATIHAAHSVYSSMEERKERHKAQDQGDISEQQAKRERNKSRLQDAVSISVAALGIKGAMREWKDTKQKHQAALDLKEKQERHHVKREVRKLKMQQMGLDERFAGSAPALSAPPFYSHHVASGSAPGGGGGGGPTYYDGNPYDTGYPQYQHQHQHQPQQQQQQPQHLPPPPAPFPPHSSPYPYVPPPDRF